MRLGIPSKSLLLSVTRVHLWLMAVAAIQRSITGLLQPLCTLSACSCAYISASTRVNGIRSYILFIEGEIEGVCASLRLLIILVYIVCTQVAVSSFPDLGARVG